MFNKIKEWYNLYLTNTVVQRTVQLLGIMIVVFLLVFAYIKYMEMQKVDVVPEPVPMTFEDVQQVDKVHEAIQESSHVYISKEQSIEATEQIREIIAEEQEPEYVVVTSGSRYKEEVKTQSAINKADAVIIAPSTEKDKPIEEIKETDVVNLNQYNIKAYPDHQLGLTIYGDGTKEIDYETKITLFNHNAYVGPAVKIEGDKITGGVRLTIPL